MSTQPTVLSDLTGPATAAADGDVVLRVRDLSVRFPSDEGLVNAVSDLSYDARLGRTLAIVGESGSGKSVSSMSVLGLHNPKRTLMSGSIMLDGQEIVGRLAGEAAEAAQQHRGDGVPGPAVLAAPVLPIGDQIAEAYRAHHNVSKAVAMKRAVEMLDLVGIPNPDRRARSYPHEFSGGMRQRAMIALGLVNNPKLLIADEPTTALDVTVQAQILDLLEGPAARVRLGDRPDHPRPGRRGRGRRRHPGHVRRSRRRARPGQGGARATRCTPTPGACCESLPSASEEQDRLRAIRGAPPSLVALPDRLLVPPPLRLPVGGRRRRLRQHPARARPPAPGDSSTRLTRCHLLEPARRP